jgi:hypothetical protein
MKWVLILIIGILVSCRSTRKIQSAISQKDTTATTIISNVEAGDSAIFINETMQQLQGSEIDYRSFTAKVDVDYRDAEGKKYDLNAIIRMQKDSIIWVSINAALGIEVMRIIITKDSVKLLDKLDKIYTIRRIDYLQEITSLPLTLSNLQDLIVGNPVFVDRNIVSYTTGTGFINLVSIGEWFKNSLVITDSDKKILRSKLDDVNILRNRTADLTYTDYEDKRGVLFATKRNITVVEKKKLDIRLNFKQYSFNDAVSFPFSVPKNYKRN